MSIRSNLFSFPTRTKTSSSFEAYFTLSLSLSQYKNTAKNILQALLFYKKRRIIIGEKIHSPKMIKEI